MPRVTILHTDKSCQLHAGVTHRYGEVQDIYIYSDPVNSYFGRRSCPFCATFHRVLSEYSLAEDDQVMGKWKETYLVDSQLKMTRG